MYNKLENKYLKKERIKAKKNHEGFSIDKMNKGH